MNESTCSNLIDLNFETVNEKVSKLSSDNNLIQLEDVNENIEVNTEKTVETEISTATIVLPTEKNESPNKDCIMVKPLIYKANALNNNDDDPFDKLEKEALNKAKQIQNQMECKTKFDKLLSLSDDDDEDQLAREEDTYVSKCFSTNILNDINGNDNCPLDLNKDNNNTNKFKKSTECQKKLLKFSLTNCALDTASPFNKLTVESEPSTSVSSIFLKHLEFDEPLLACESPLKLIDDDDDYNNNDNENFDINVLPGGNLACNANINDEEKFEADLEMLKIPEHNLACNANTNDEEKFEADLEMLKIPILEELSSKPIQNKMKLNSPTINTNFQNIENDNDATNNENEILSKVVPSLEAIKAKLECKRNQHKQEDISDLINNIKDIMITDESVINHKTKQQVTELLENLKRKIVQPNAKDSTCDQYVDSNSNEKVKTIEDIPHCMVSSTSTYDGENEPHDDLKRPEILIDSSMENLTDIKPSISSSLSSPQPSIQTDLNEIVEKLTQALSDRDESSKHSTVILVMKTPSSLTNDDKCRQQQPNNDYSPSFNDESTMPRRRSHSFSLNNTVKVLEFHSVIDKCDTSKTIQQKVKEINNSISGSPKSKTPGYLMRRNSFSGGSNLRKLDLSKSNKLITASTTNMNCKNQQQQQQYRQNQSVIKSLNMPLLRPDPKRKLKLPTESIMKSSEPLKATIPIKKIVPKIQITTPNSQNQNQDILTYKNDNNHNATIVASTPLQQIKRTSTLGAIGESKILSTPRFTAVPTTNTATGSIRKSMPYRVSNPSINTNNALMPSTNNLTALKRRTTADLNLNKVKSIDKITKPTTKTTTRMASTTTISKKAATVAAATGDINRLRRSSSINPTNKASNKVKNCYVPNEKSPTSQTRLVPKNKENQHP